MTWWVVKKPGSAPIFWQHHPEYGSPNKAARAILNVALLHPSTTIRVVTRPPALKSAGRRGHIEIFIERCL